MDNVEWYSSTRKILFEIILPSPINTFPFQPPLIQYCASLNRNISASLPPGKEIRFVVESGKLFCCSVGESHLESFEQWWEICPEGTSIRASTRIPLMLHSSQIPLTVEKVEEMMITALESHMNDPLRHEALFAFIDEYRSKGLLNIDAWLSKDITTVLFISKLSEWEKKRCTVCRNAKPDVLRIPCKCANICHRCIDNRFTDCSKRRLRGREREDMVRWIKIWENCIHTENATTMEFRTGSTVVISNTMLNKHL